jgi:hypothetical protein
MNEFRIIDSYVGFNEIIIRTENDLRDEIQSILNRSENRVITLKSPDSGDLTLGIGTPYGFAEYIDKSGKPPYIIATDSNNDKKSDYYEFDSGGTPTPIPSEKCLLIDRVIEIAVFFFRNKKLPLGIKWDEE